MLKRIHPNKPLVPYCDKCGKEMSTDQYGANGWTDFLTAIEHCCDDCYDAMWENWWNKNSNPHPTDYPPEVRLLPYETYYNKVKQV